ncbi:RluA family pseudouridine synthase [Roseivirga sp.]|uniref:RluA family pseudouridine synthase n=1 Tax=Roseivirga sp. TaxID=1964215 RepID=UPI003B51DA67
MSKISHTNTENTIIHKVPHQEKAQRIADYAKGIFLQYPTKTSIKKALKQKLIWVNNEVATTATWIKGGETIRIKLPESRTDSSGLKLNLSIIYEDDFLAIINKPAGVLVSGNRFVTIANALPQNLKPSQQNDTCIPWPVHRLDYGTTGVLVVAKTAESLRHLSEQFQNKQVKKTYYAICTGLMPEQQQIETSIDNKEAFTSYQVEQAVPSVRFQQLNLVRLHPSTGRRHQLRKHLAGIGHPILGDQDYGVKGEILIGKGIYLHAASIQLVHPHSKQKLVFNSPLPKKFSKIFPSA